MRSQRHMHGRDDFCPRMDCFRMQRPRCRVFKTGIWSTVAGRPRETWERQAGAWLHAPVQARALRRGRQEGFTVREESAGRRAQSSFPRRIPRAPRVPCRERPRNRPASDSSRAFLPSRNISVAVDPLIQLRPGIGPSLIALTAQTQISVCVAAAAAVTV